MPIPDHAFRPFRRAGTITLVTLSLAGCSSDNAVLDSAAPTKLVVLDEKTAAIEISRYRAMHGLGRAILNNMVKGVSEGYVKKLEIHGVGFKAAVQGKVVNLSLGYSHPVNYTIPDQIKVTVEENTKLTIEGPDKQVVGMVASEIRSFYPPEPYKGKGVRYSGEKIIRKEGKTVQ